MESSAYARLSYWRLPSGIKVDFVVNDMQLVIDAKATAKVTPDHLKGLREVARDHRRIKQRVVVYLVRTSRRTDDGIGFCRRANLAVVWAGDLF